MLNASTESESKRVLFAGLFHETHTFLPGQTVLADCDVLVADELLAEEGDISPLGGALETARRLGWEVIPALDVRAMPGPVMSDDVVDLWWNGVKAAIEGASEDSEEGSSGLDSVYLILHGAMVSESYTDVEGEVLSRIRALVGLDMPIVGTTDLHANFTPLMAQNSNVLITYHENPHTDGRARAIDAAEILDRLMRSSEKAVTIFHQTPIVWPPTGTATAAKPMLELERMARDIEATDEQILAVNIHAGYSFADIPETGVSFSANTVGAPEKAEAALKRLAEVAWQRREQGNVVDAPFAEIWPRLQEALNGPGTGPIVIAEPSENIGGGSPGDGTGLLRELLAHNIAPSAVVLADPKAVNQLYKLGDGEKTVMKLGGAFALPGAGPIELEVELLSTSDGKFDLEDDHSHLGSMYGKHIDMGPCATVRHTLPDGGHIFILLTSLKMPPFDLGQLRSQGIVPEEMAVIGAKAAVAHRQAFIHIARAHFSVSTPGVCSSDLKTLPYKKIRRPIFPLEELAQ
jgi:microcystin degradation protein MlrC